MREDPNQSMSNVLDADDCHIFVVIPAYNEAKIIHEVLEELKEKRYKIILVDDGSTDSTYKIAQKSLKNYNGFIYKHSLNMGVGAALRTGIEAALKKGAQVIVTFDADGQHDPQDIKSLIEPVINDVADIVNGTRNFDDMPVSKKIANQIMNILTATFYGVYLKDSQSGFKALSRHTSEIIDIQSRGFGSISEIDGEIKKHNLRLKEVPIKTIYTEYTMKKGTNLVVGLKILSKLIIDQFRKVF